MRNPVTREALIADIKPLAEAGAQFTVSTDAHYRKDVQQPFHPEI
jgi:histidinol phosphatase-like PHP family hydrolase